MPEETVTFTNFEFSNETMDPFPLTTSIAQRPTVAEAEVIFVTFELITVTYTVL
jgi:hypothetical protein